MALAGALAFDPLAFISVAALVVMLAILRMVSPSRLSLRAWPVANVRLLVASLIAAAPWLLHGVEMAATSLVFGLVSILNPNAPGSAGVLWGALAVVWSMILSAAAIFARHNGERCHAGT